MYIYPRLDTPIAAELLSELSPLNPHELKDHASDRHPRTTWYPTGMNRVSTHRLTTLQDAIRSVAQDFGYPATRRQRSFTGFDQALSAKLVGLMDILPADAAHDGVWSFMSLVLVPDVAFWRFPNRNFRDDYERLLGRPRNVFRRLWWRAYTLGDAAAEGLLEDETVAIMERPSIGGDRRVAQTLAAKHLSIIDATPDVSRTELLRQVGKRLRRLTPVVTLAALDQEDLERLLDEIYDQAVIALSAER